MKLALSSRLWESPQGYRVTLREHIGIAADLGYEGVELRYPQLPARDEWDGIKALLQERGISVVFGPCAGMPKDEAATTDAIRVLDTLSYLGAKHLKAIPMTEDDIPSFRVLADLAAERGVRLNSQLHANTLTDTVERTERALEAINHPNVGLIFDAAHLPFADDNNLQGALQRLRKWTTLANLQTYKLATPDDEKLQHVTINGKQWVIALPGDPRGVDVAAYVEGLHDIVFEGWFTVMPACDPSTDPVQVARQYYEFLKPIA